MLIWNSTTCNLEYSKRGAEPGNEQQTKPVSGQHRCRSQASNVTHGESSFARHPELFLLLNDDSHRTMHLPDSTPPRGGLMLLDSSGEVTTHADCNGGHTGRQGRGSAGQVTTRGTTEHLVWRDRALHSVLGREENISIPQYKHCK